MERGYHEQPAKSSWSARKIRHRARLATEIALEALLNHPCIRRMSAARSSVQTVRGAVKRCRVSPLRLNTGPEALATVRASQGGCKLI